MDRGDLWWLAETGAARFSGKGGWVPAASSLLSHGEGTTRWISTRKADEFDGAVFDEAQGRFISDISLGVERDSRGDLRVQTRGGWRAAELEGDTVKLVRTGAPTGSPEVHQEWSMNPRWKVATTEREDGSQAVSFVFLPAARQLGNDPFGSRGRLPDEDAVSIGSSGAAVWIGTRYGLRAVGSEEIQLPGMLVEAQRTANGVLYSRTADGIYSLGPKGWIHQRSPDGLFERSRSITLQVGPGLTVSATEASGGTIRSTLGDFDQNRGRFLMDIIGEFEAFQDRVFLATAAGLETISLNEHGGLSNQSMTLPNVPIASLRRANDDSLFAMADGGRIWQFVDNSRWVEVASHDSPFESPQVGAISDVVKWRRTYSRPADRWQLISNLGEIRLVRGKLASDYVESVAEGDDEAEVTAAGVLLKNTLLPRLPEPARYGVEHGTIVGRTRSSGLRLEGSSWRPAPGVMRSQSAVFGGMHWQVSMVDSMEPTIDVRPAQSQGAPPLDDRGQFPFDDIQAVATQRGEALLAHENGITVYNTADWRPVREIPISALPAPGPDIWFAPSGECQALIVGSHRLGTLCDGDAALRPENDRQEVSAVKPEFQWGGGIKGETTITRIGQGDSIELDRPEADPVILPVPDRALAVAGGYDRLWVLTARRLYRLDKDLVPSTSRRHDGQKARSGSQPGFLLTQVFFGPGSAELSIADNQKTREIAKIFIEKYSGRKIAVESYVDPSGSVEQKEALAAGRAETVARILKKAGIEGPQIESIAHPSAPTATLPLAWAQMRRVDISVKPEQ